MAINYCNQEIKGTLTTTGTITSGGSIYVPDYLIHTGDADTKIGFNTDDNVEIRVGGNLQISASSSRAYLRYQGSNKLQTDSTGINITGGLTTTASSSIAGANVTADFAWGDSIQATFGAGNDLKLYSNGTDGYVYAPVDDLVLQAADDVFIYAQDGENAIIARGNGAVELYYDNSKKLQTTSSGVESLGNIKLDDGSGASPNIQFQNEDDDSWYIYNDANGKFQIQQSSTIRATFSSSDLELTNDLKVSGGGITLLGTGRIQGIDTVSAGTDAASKTYVDNAVSGAGSGTYLPLAGGTMTGDIAMGDNDITGLNKITYTDGIELFGASNNNYLKFKSLNANNGGILFQDGDSTIQGYIYYDGGATSAIGFLSGAGEWAVRCIENDAVELRYDNSIKLTTASGGVSITGDVMLDDDEMITWGGNSIIQHTGSHTYIGDNSSGSVISITGGYTTLSGGIAATNTSFSGTMNIAGGIYHIGDTDTFFGFIGGANTWSVSTGGSTRLDINDAGVRFGGAGARIVTVKDEDDMAANSNVALATQQSIKAYVDNKVTGVLTYQGTWNADTNSPTLSSGSGTPGYYYIVSVAGSTNLDGITDWAVGDWAVFSDQATDAWQKIDNTAVGNVSGSGVNNRLVLWSGTSTVDSDSDFYVDGDTLYTDNLGVSGNISLSGDVNKTSGNLTVDVAGDINLDADGGDIRLYDGGVLYGNLAGGTGNFHIKNPTQDKDIVFTGNDGGSTFTALTLDMSDAGAAIFNQALYIPHYIYHTGDTNTYFGFSNDDTWRITTGGSTAITVYNNSIVTTGDFTVGDELTITTIGNATGDPDKFLCASGANKVGYRTGAQVLSDIGAASSGSLASYLPLAGGTMTGGVTMVDDVGILFGSGGDSFIKHTGAQMSMFNDVGHMYIVNRANDKGIYFQTDDGSGGLTNYIKIDGSAEYTQFDKPARMMDNVYLQFGNSNDSDIYHNGTDMFMRNFSDDGDVRFFSDDGSGGTAEYLRLDGGITSLIASKDLLFGADAIYTKWGASQDLIIGHDGSNSKIENYTGHLNIIQNANDKDITFQNDDGSGGLTEYFRIDGDTLDVRFSKPILLFDSVNLKIGAGQDLELHHNASDSYIQNSTGHLYILNYADDKDIIFKNDDGSGNITEYFRVDGGATKVIANKNFAFVDNVKAEFGDSGDLEIYHDGSHSRIKDVGTGHLVINATDFVVNNSADTANMIIASDTGSVNLYYNATQKFRTISNGVEVTGKTDTDTLLIGSSTEVDAILDEDNMASNSATSLATQQSIKAYVDAISVPTVNNSTISLSAGTGLTGSSSFTLNQASNQTITFSLSVNALSTSTSAGDADFFIVGTTMGAEYKMAPANIALSHFNNDSGWTTNAGTVTSVSVGTGLDISNSTTTPSITMDLTELTLGSGIDSSATGLSLDFSEFGTATTDEVTSFIVYNGGDSQEERLLLADVHDIDAYWKYTPVVFNGAFNDGSSSTSTYYIPIAGSYSEGTSSQEYQFAAMPFAGRIRTLMMQNTGTTPTTTNSTRMKIYKNGSLAYTTSYQVPTNGGSVGAYILFDNNTSYTFAAGDRIQFAYNKQFTGDYWRDVAFTAVVEFQQM